MDPYTETVIIGKSKHGTGIFATRDLPKHTFLFKITGRPLNFKQTLDLGKDECYALRVGMDQYIIPSDPFRLSNHSCSPNCGVNSRLEFFTLENIRKNEELCWDYSTSMLERHWIMNCNCGCPGCRHIISDFDLLPDTLQEKYMDMGIVFPFIARIMKKWQKPKSVIPSFYSFASQKIS